MKYLLLIFLIPNLANAENSIFVTLINDKVTLYSEPKFESKRIKILKESGFNKLHQINENTEIQTNKKGIWINLMEPNGWVFSKDINIELEKEDNCSDKLSLPAKLNFGSFDIIIVNKNLLFLSSFELGSSFNQQIGYWEWNKNNIVGNVFFDDSTLIDCLNICYENEDTSSCNKNCKKEILKEFQKTRVVAELNFIIEINEKNKTLRFKDIKESNVTNKSYLKHLGFEKNKLYKAECLAI